jgi:hypothetical protein
MKEKDPRYQLNSRKNKQVATRCRVCGNPLNNAQEITNEIHEYCDNDNKNIYVM